MKTFARFGTKWMSQRQRSTFLEKATTRELWRRWVRLLFISPNKFLPSGRAGLCLLVTFACCQHCKCGSFDPWGPQGAIFLIPIDFLSFSQFCNALALPHLNNRVIFFTNNHIWLYTLIDFFDPLNMAVPCRVTCSTSTPGCSSPPCSSSSSSSSSSSPLAASATASQTFSSVSP